MQAISIGARSGFDFETLTVGATVKQLTATKYKHFDSSALSRQWANSAMVTVETADVRITFDGTAPVAATTGHFVQSGSTFFIDSLACLQNFKAIRNASTDATFQVTYFY